jgi:hypothetical protein
MDYFPFIEAERRIARRSPKEVRLGCLFDNPALSAWDGRKVRTTNLELAGIRLRPRQLNGCCSAARFLTWANEARLPCVYEELPCDIFPIYVWDYS